MVVFSKFSQCPCWKHFPNQKNVTFLFILCEADEIPRLQPSLCPYTFGICNECTCFFLYFFHFCLISTNIKNIWTLVGFYLLKNTMRWVERIVGIVVKIFEWITKFPTLQWRLLGKNASLVNGPKSFRRLRGAIEHICGENDSETSGGLCAWNPMRVVDGRVGWRVVNDVHEADWELSGLEPCWTTGGEPFISGRRSRQLPANFTRRVDWNFTPPVDRQQFQQCLRHSSVPSPYRSGFHLCSENIPLQVLMNARFEARFCATEIMGYQLLKGDDWQISILRPFLLFPHVRRVVCFSRLRAVRSDTELNVFPLKILL